MAAINTLLNSTFDHHPVQQTPTSNFAGVSVDNIPLYLDDFNGFNDDEWGYIPLDGDMSGRDEAKEELALEHQPWGNLYDGLFLSDLPQGESVEPVQSGESGIETWAAANLTSSQETLTPPWTMTDASTDLGSENGSSQICYGMLYRTAARLSGEMAHLETKLHSPEVLRRANYYVFSLRRAESHLTLYFADGDEFAILNAQVSKALLDVLDLPSVDFDVLADGVTVRDTVRTAKKETEAMVRVHINIYGAPEIRNELAHSFSKHKFWLQHPEHQRTGSTYDNPHCVSFADVSLADLTKPEILEPDESAAQDKQEEFQQAISEVYASLKRDSRLKTIDGGSRLTTLLPHQKTALDFMLQREVGPIESEFSLWAPDTSIPNNNDGEQGFAHIITKTKSRTKPPEIGGGILADEMGMGKSLSILALVIKRLDEANAWRHGEDQSLNELIVEGEQTLSPSRATLILVPSALLLHEWQTEIRKHIREELKVVVYHGRSRGLVIPGIADADIVLSTYQTIAIESPVKFQEKKSPLLEFAWFRIVLDEAHVIRRRTTTFYETVSRLSAKSRWCLSGTPIQNKLEDIGNLFSFIQAHPFHKIGMFRRFIALPFEHVRTSENARKYLGKLIDSVCLRRSRGLLHLPEQNEILEELELSKPERDQYEKTKRQMSRRLQRGTLIDGKENTFGQFHVQLQLRILCNHGTFQHPYSWMHRDLQTEREDFYYLRSGEGAKEVKCSLCYQSMPYLSTNQIYRTLTRDCAHVLCDQCLEGQLEDGCDATSKLSNQCPICRPLWENKIPPDKSNPAIQEPQDDQFAPTGVSAKMDALIKNLSKELHSTKSIVFSCWTKTLDLIARHLKDHNIEFGRIDGSSAVADRSTTLEDFETSVHMRVLIMTTGTGAFGLNLAAANRIFIVEPQWNPSIENQAIARALRLGQEQHVQVVRYVVKDTVETEMRNQQRRKIKMASLADMTVTS